MVDTAPPRNRRWWQGLTFRFDPSVGKGSHGRLHVGGRFTTVPQKEIGKGLLAAMLKDLDMDKETF